MAQCLISIIWCINIFTEYSALFFRASVWSHLVVPWIKKLKHAEWLCYHETARRLACRQHMGLGISLIQVLNWLVHHCHLAVSHTFVPSNDKTGLSTYVNITIHGQHVCFCFFFFFQCLWSVLLLCFMGMQEIQITI